MSQQPDPRPTPSRHWIVEYVISTIGWPTDEDDRPDLTAIQALNLPPGTKPSTLNLLSIAVSGFYKAQMPLMAAALAYRTIFGLVPVLIITLSILGAFASEKGIKETVDSALKYTGLSEVFLAPERASDGPAATPDAPAKIEPTPPTPAAESSGAMLQRENLDKWIGQLSSGVKAISFTGIGIAALLLLVYAAVSMVVEIEYAFNRIYEAQAGKSWARRIMQYWTLMTLGALFLVGTFYVGNVINAAVTKLIATNVSGTFASVLLQIAGGMVQISITGLILLVIYFTVPNARVRFLPAAVGAFFAAICWEVLKYAFREYVRFATAPSGSYHKFYGSLALLPLFLFWIYCTWLIVLFGLQIARSIQLFGRLRLMGPNLLAIAAARGPSEPAIVDSGVVIPIMVGVARNFDQGRPTSAADLRADVRLSEPILREVLRQLARARLLLRVDAPSADRRAGILLPGIPGTDAEFFTLARAPAQIPVDHLLTLGYTISDGVQPADQDESRLPPALVRLREAQRQAARGMSLADLLQTPAPSVVEPPAPPAIPVPPSGATPA